MLDGLKKNQLKLVSVEWSDRDTDKYQTRIKRRKRVYFIAMLYKTFDSQPSVTGFFSI